MDIFVNAINWLIDGLVSGLIWIVELLPSSPFLVINNTVITQYLPWINWIIPVFEITVILQLWLYAILGFYLYKAILRFMQII